MGGKCCVDRKDNPAGNHGSIKAPGGGGSGGGRKSTNAGNEYDTKKRAISVGYASKGDDAEKFDQAFESNDLKAFVSLLASEQQIESFEDKMHPWAAEPKTVGALAGTQLAILASVAARDNPKVKDDLREAGAILPLVEFLKSPHDDRMHAAIVSLSYLTSECPLNSVQTYKAGAMPVLLNHLDSKVAGVQAAAATILRNICIESDEHRSEFVEKGGLKGFVLRLSISPDPALNHTDVLLEAVLNLQDIIERDDGTVIQEYAAAAVAAGAVEKLKKLSQNDDEEVRASAEEVLTALATATTEKAGGGD